MKLKDLLAEGRFDMEGPESVAVAVGGPCPGCDDPECECQGGADEGADDDACPSCGRRPGDGVGSDCDDPLGCGHWKSWARDAAAEWKRDDKREGGVDEGQTADFFDKYMAETLWIEDRKARQLKAPVVAEGVGKIRQKRTQESPANRIRMKVK